LYFVLWSCIAAWPLNRITSLTGTENRKQTKNKAPSSKNKAQENKPKIGSKFSIAYGPSKIPNP
jgi:hypothetical protein